MVFEIESLELSYRGKIQLLEDNYFKREFDLQGKNFAAILTQGIFLRYLQ